MIWAVLLVPSVAGLLAMLIPMRSAPRWLLMTAAAAHITLVAGLWVRPSPASHWIAADLPGRLFLTITSVLFLAMAFYTIGYLRRESGKAIKDFQEGFLFTNKPEATFIGCLLFFLATMSLATLSQHPGLLWIAVEATTLVSAPLIYFHRHHRSLEATWKYLLICSVGIALALLGNFFLVIAAKGKAIGLDLANLQAHATALNPVWLKAAFVLFVVGYGTKMGLAPMHNWLPDAHSEAPSVVSALLSGALLNCAFLAILRFHGILSAAGLGDFSSQILVLFGFISMATAAVFLIRQTDAKRMLAYSSIEHMGILALGTGIGGIAASGALLHAISHSLAKAMLFLTAGNLMHLYNTKDILKIRGVLQVAPVTGTLWVAGFLAIAGFPPFGLFLSELTILTGALESGRWLVASGYLLTLGIIFVALTRIFLTMSFGINESWGHARISDRGMREPSWSLLPGIALGAGVLALGLYVPPKLWQCIQDAVLAIGVH